MVVDITYEDAEQFWIHGTSYRTVDLAKFSQACEASFCQISNNHFCSNILNSEELLEKKMIRGIFKNFLKIPINSRTPGTLIKKNDIFWKY